MGECFRKLSAQAAIKTPRFTHFILRHQLWALDTFRGNRLDFGIVDQALEGGRGVLGSGREASLKLGHGLVLEVVHVATQQFGRPSWIIWDWSWHHVVQNVCGVYWICRICGYVVVEMY